MAGTLHAATVETPAGGPVALTGQSAAKAWGLVKNPAGTPSVGQSLNVSSITDVGSGDLQYGFTNSFVDTDYSALPQSSFTSSGVDGIFYEGLTRTVSAFEFKTYGGGWVDSDYNELIVNGDLA